MNANIKAVTSNGVSGVRACGVGVLRSEASEKGPGKVPGKVPGEASVLPQSSKSGSLRFSGKRYGFPQR